MPTNRIGAFIVPPAMVLLATLFAGACSARTDAPVEQVTEPSLRQALLLSSAPGPADRSCHIVREKLPPADRLVDSIAVMDAIRRLEPSSVLLSVKFDTLGATEFVGIIEAHGAQAEQLAQVAELELRRQTESDAWRLKLKSGPDPSIAVGHSEFCPPRLVNSDEVSRALQEKGVRDPGRTVVLFRVGRNGRALDTRVSHHTGPMATVRAYRALGPRLRFLPALIDGFATPVWASIKVYTPNPSGPGWSHGND